MRRSSGWNFATRMKTAMALPRARGVGNEDLFPSAEEAYARTGHRSKRLYPKVCAHAIRTCLGSISQAVKSGMTSTIADVPTFAFGEPVSDVDDVTDHVKTVLQLKGYVVDTYAGSKTIAISWAPPQEHDTRSRSRRERPKRDGSSSRHAPVEPRVDSRFDVGL